jgi:acetyl-CoA C-acetyltransferase
LFKKTKKILNYDDYFPHKDWNLARECVLGTTLDPHTPAYNIQRACGTSLEAARQIALKISNQQIESGIAGGCDSNSDLPLLISKALTKKWLALRNEKNVLSKLKLLTSFRPSDFKLVLPAIVEPSTHLSMGERSFILKLDIFQVHVIT